jgi:hypothetical protein
MVLK